MSVNHIFIDTNILVYAHDADAGRKHELALKIVKSLWDRPYPPAISCQVLSELYVSLSKKGADVRDCRKIVEIYFDWEIVPNDFKLFQEALTLKERFKLSLWDAQIIAAAQNSKAVELWTEDLSDGQDFDGVKVSNPLLGAI